MPALPSIQYGDLKGNHTISGTAEPNARVLLFNPVEGRYVKSVDADASGNFDFGVLDSTVPLQIRIAGSNDFTCVATSPTVKPAAALQLNNGKMIIKPQYFPGADGQHYFITGPKGVFIDRNGPGSGAAIEFELASPGDIYPSPGTDVPYDPYVYGDPPYIPSVGGHPLKSYTMTSFGQGYVDPVLVVTGTVRTYPSSNGYGWSYLPGINPATGETYKQQYPGGIVYEGTAPPPPEHFAGYGWEVSQNTWYGKLDVVEEIPCFTCLTADANDVLSNITSRWGSANTWGQYQAGNPKTYGPRVMVQVPGYSNIEYNVSCTTEDSTQPGPVLQEKIVEIMAATKNPLSDAVWGSAEYKLYLAIIHGFNYPGGVLQTGHPREWNNSAPNMNFSNSAFAAQSGGIITTAELEYLKGWLAQSVQVNAMINKIEADWNTWKAANLGVLSATGHTNSTLNYLVGLAGEGIHQLGDALRRYNQASAHESWNDPVFLGYAEDGVTQITRESSVSLIQVFWQEWQQTRYRTPGIRDGSRNDPKIIKSILTKMSTANGTDYLNGIVATDSTGTYRWDFRGNSLQKVQLP